MRSLIACVLLLAACNGAKKPGDMGTVADLASGGLTLEPTPAKSGTITLFDYLQAGGNMHTSMLAYFYTSDGKPGPCSVASGGGCRLELCPVSDGGVAATPAQTEVDAGTLTLDGIGATFMLTEQTGSGFVSYVGDVDRSWNGGDMLTIHATGGAVPAFSVTAAGPPRATILTPAVPANGMPIVASRAAGLPITWQPVATGNMRLEIDGSGVTLQCSAAASAGTLTVPPALLALVPDERLTVGAATVGTATAMAGDFPVQLTATAPAEDVNGMASAAGWGAELKLQ